MPLRISDEQRSMIASIVSTATSGGICERTTENGITVREHLCLCCADDAIVACARIVGEEYAEALWVFAHDGLGCGRMGDQTDEREQRYLDLIADLDELRTTEENGQHVVGAPAELG